MGLKILSKPKLKKPILVAGWPGIGNIGLMSIEHMRQQVDAHELAEIEPWEFFYPKAVKVKNGIIEELLFPSCRFYYRRFSTNDIIFFAGEEQPSDGVRRYAGGRKAYEMANYVVDLAEKFGCRRIYTSGAAVSLVHHSMPPRVWAVVNRPELCSQFADLPGINLMSSFTRRNDNSLISGLNGILLGVARERGMDAVCVMGEIPVYLQGLALPYPKAAKSVIEAFSSLLGVPFNSSSLNLLIQSMDDRIDDLMRQFSSSLPVQLRKGIADGIEHLKKADTDDTTLTREDVRKAIDEIENFFKKGENNDEGSV